MKKVIRLISINLLVLTSLLFVLESTGQIIYFVANRHWLPFKYANTHQKIFELHPYLVGRPKASIQLKKWNKTISTTSFNTRWTGAVMNSSAPIRVACLGGSTTFGTGVTDIDTWPALLQKKLGLEYEVINYGVPGYSTAENIIQMALVVPEHAPQIVLFYEGWNDLRNYHQENLGVDYYEHGISQYGNLLTLDRNKSTTNKSVIFSKIKGILSQFQPSTKTKVIADLKVDSIYIRNLKTLQKLSENINSTAIFIPQILNYSGYIKRETQHPWTKRIANSAMPSLMERMNQKMLSICPDSSTRCIVATEALNYSWTEADFIDEGHFSREGGIAFANIIADVIKYELSNNKTSK